MSFLFSLWMSHVDAKLNDSKALALLSFFSKDGWLKALPIFFLAGFGLQQLMRLWELYKGRREDEDMWKSHVDMNQVQACVMSTEHLGDLGRIEKRTLFVKDINQMFGGNSYAVNKLLEAAAKTSKEDAIVTKFLDNEDKWHFSNICTNQISSLFAPSHIFFNEARRCASYYKSAWYCFTLTCTRTEGAGRYFITPYKPVSDKEDVGALRIRIVLVNEQELRDICSGAISPPSWGFFNK
jgi:hypothetical protein